MQGHIGVPHILAHQDAQAVAAERRHLGHRAGNEDAGLVEHAVIGQMMLEDDFADLARFEQQRRIVAMAVLFPRRADQQSRPAIAGGEGQVLDGFGDLAQEGVFQHQILGRIARQAKLGQHHQIGAFGLLARGEDQGSIAGDVADRGIDLGQRDGKRFGHEKTRAKKRPHARGWRAACQSCPRPSEKHQPMLRVGTHCYSSVKLAALRKNLTGLSLSPALKPRRHINPGRITVTTIATLRKSTLLSRAALIALTVGAAGSALAAEEEQPSETIVVTGTRFNTDAAPAKASLDTTEPQTIINKSYIENFVTPIADYVTILSIVPGMTGGDSNGAGLSDGGAKNTLRGMGDGNFVMQYDGIPFGDTNGPTHHNISYFPASTIGSAVVDRGPGNAGNLGASTYGGTVKLFSQTLTDDPHVEGAFTYGSFGTQLEQANVQTGKMDWLGGTKFMLNIQALDSDGALHLQDVRERNFLYKSETPIGDNWKLTMFADYSYLKEHLSDNNGLTPAQVTAFGKNFSLQNSNAALPTYWAYNWTNKETDMDYIRLQGEVTSTTHVDNTAYTYAYWNHTFSPNTQTQECATVAFCGASSLSTNDDSLAGYQAEDLVFPEPHLRPDQYQGGRGGHRSAGL